MRETVHNAVVNSQFTRFVLVGILNTLFGYSCFALLLYFGLHYAVALGVATVAGVAFNFKTIGSLVFKSHDNRLIFRFILVYGFVYGVNVSGLKLLIMQGVDIYLGGAAMIFLSAIISFELNKRVVFKNA